MKIPIGLVLRLVALGLLFAGPAAASAPRASSLTPGGETPPLAPAPAAPSVTGETGDAVAMPPPVSAPGELAAPPSPLLPPLPPSPPPEGRPAGDIAGAPPPGLDVRVGTLEGKLAAVEESASTTSAVVDRLTKIKLSGYIQGRFEWHGDSSNYLDAGKSRVSSQFLVRRGRLKAIYEGKNAEYLLQIDAVGSGVTLKDAEATFVDTWTPLAFRLTMGQFKWPFGYEILQSSGDREMPERALVIRRLFPGERDRGLRLTARHQWLRFAGALVNGNGTQDAVYVGTDQNGFKDLVARVGGDFGVVVGGLSGYWGRRLAATPERTVGVTWTDLNMDKMVTPDEITFSPSAPASYKRFSIVRLGADVQTYIDIPGLGGLALKGELVYAKDHDLGFGAVAADRCQDRTQIGWIVTAAQNVGEHAGLVVRVDSFDPNFTRALDDSCVAAIARGLGDRVNTYGGGVLLYPSANLKATLTYEHVAEQNLVVKNDIFTAQLQARF